MVTFSTKQRSTTKRFPKVKEEKFKPKPVVTKTAALSFINKFANQKYSTLQYSEDLEEFWNLLFFVQHYQPRVTHEAKNYFYSHCNYYEIQLCNNAKIISIHQDWWQILKKIVTRANIKYG